MKWLGFNNSSRFKMTFHELMKLRNAGLLFSGTKMALKSLRKKTTKLRSFLREYSTSLYLSSCPFIINMYGIAFETDECYIFAQEYAPAGDLFDIIPPQVRRSTSHNIRVKWIRVLPTFKRRPLSSDPDRILI